jgi:N-dimethylarginine dimethylaminohydrolase
VAAHLSIPTVVHCELIDPRFYHLDTCFCPLNKDKAIFVRSAFSADSIREMEKHIELIAVPEGDAERFVCNTVVLGTDLVQPAGCDSTYAMLKTHGFSCHPVALGEFLKGGGSAKCLSLRLDRVL